MSGIEFDATLDAAILEALCGRFDPPETAPSPAERLNALAESLGIDAKRMREFTLVQVVELIRLRGEKTGFMHATCAEDEADEIALKRTGGSPARHVACVGAHVAAAAPSARRSNYRCPNPRDCGDPTCDGSCGY